MFSFSGSSAYIAWERNLASNFHMEAMFYNQLNILNHACRITGFLQVLDCSAIIGSDLGFKNLLKWAFSFLKDDSSLLALCGTCWGFLAVFMGKHPLNTAKNRLIQLCNTLTGILIMFETFYLINTCFECSGMFYVYLNYQLFSII